MNLKDRKAHCVGSPGRLSVLCTMISSSRIKASGSIGAHFAIGHDEVAKSSIKGLSLSRARKPCLDGGSK